MRGLRHPVGLDDRHGEQLRQAVEHRSRQRRRRRPDEAQARRAAGLGRAGQHHLVHGRHGRVVGGAEVVQPAVELEGVEARRGHHAAAGRERCQQAGHDPVDVEERHDRQRAVRRGEVQRRGDVLRRRGQVPLAERHDLRPRRRAGRVEHERFVVGRRSGRFGSRRTVRSGGRAGSRPGGDLEVDRQAATAEPDDRRLRRRGGQRGRRAAVRHERRGAEVVQVEAELLLAVLRVQRRRAADRHGRQQDQRHLRPVRQDDGDPVARSEPGRAEALGQPVDRLAEGRRGRSTRPRPSSAPDPSHPARAGRQRCRGARRHDRAEMATPAVPAYPRPVRVCIVGAGAIGGLLATRLAVAGER